MGTGSPVLATAVFLLAQKIANLRIALLTTFCLLFMGLVRLWTESMQTLALVAVIAPYNRDRQRARERMRDGRFVEVFVDAPLSVCEERDPKGLYAKARAGEITDFTGVDAPYEAPQQPEVHLDSGGGASPDELADRVVAFLETNGFA